MFGLTFTIHDLDSEQPEQWEQVKSRLVTQVSDLPLAEPVSYEEQLAHHQHLVSRVLPATDPN
jgi:hypothetical protein